VSSGREPPFPLPTLLQFISLRLTMSLSLDREQGAYYRENSSLAALSTAPCSGDECSQLHVLHWWEVERRPLRQVLLFWLVHKKGSEWGVAFQALGKEPIGTRMKGCMVAVGRHTHQTSIAKQERGQVGWVGRRQLLGPGMDFNSRRCHFQEIQTMCLGVSNTTFSVLVDLEFCTGDQERL
jgi:hypothetical protein